MSKVELFAGREGADNTASLSVGDVVTDRTLYDLVAVLETLRFAYDVAEDNGRHAPPLSDEQLAEWELLADTGGPWPDAAAALHALSAEVRRLRAMIAAPQVVESLPGQPAVVFSTAPAISTPEELAELMGWHPVEAKACLDALDARSHVAIYQITQTHTDAPQQSPPDSRQ